MIETNDYNYKTIINQLEQQLEKTDKKDKTDRFKRIRPIKRHVTWQMIISKMIGHCFKCNIEFAYKAPEEVNKHDTKKKSVKNRSKSNKLQTYHLSNQNKI